MTKPSLRFWGLLASLFMTTSLPAQDYTAAPTEERMQCDFGSCEQPSIFEVNASLLFLKPGGGNLQYGMLASPLPLPTPNWAGQDVDPSYTPAFNVGLRYAVPDSSWDFELDWTHLSTSDNASVVGDANQFVGPNYEIGPDASLFRVATGEVDFRYDAVNLDMGQLFRSDGSSGVRVFAGIQYARIDQTLAATFESQHGIVSNGNETKSKFNGIGPRLGMKADLETGNFNFFGELAGAALIGTSQSRIGFSATSPELIGLGITPPNTQSLTSPDATQVVPSIDTKLGVGYTITFKNRGRLKFEAGYQAAVYFNALNQYSLSEVVTPPVDQSVGVYLRTAEHLQSNFTAHGPYLTAGWEF